ncbi:MAG TPA: hypothetical protein VF097_09400 [Actinomycetota bacterium]
MRRAIVAGGLLGVLTGLLFVYHEALRLSVAWPVVAGLALWGSVGRDGSRGLNTAVAAAVGVGAGYASYAVVAEFLPVTRMWLGITIGVLVGVLVLVGVWSRWFPLAGALIGFAVFAGLFEPLWAESPAAVRTRGIETLTVALLGVLTGIVAATLVRAVAERAAPETEAERDEEEAPAPAGDVVGGPA